MSIVGLLLVHSVIPPVEEMPSNVTKLGSDGISSVVSTGLMRVLLAVLRSTALRGTGLGAATVLAFSVNLGAVGWAGAGIGGVRA